MGESDKRCMKCRKHLFGEIEIDTHLCGRCADREYEREQARREWEYYHPTDAVTRRRA